MRQTAAPAPSDGPCCLPLLTQVADHADPLYEPAPPTSSVQRFADAVQASLQRAKQQPQPLPQGRDASNSLQQLVATPPATLACDANMQVGGGRMAGAGSPAVWRCDSHAYFTQHCTTPATHQQPTTVSPCVCVKASIWFPTPLPPTPHQCFELFVNQCMHGFS
jgi:hypothetical protein